MVVYQKINKKSYKKRRIVMTVKSRIFTLLTIISMLTCTIIPVNASQSTDKYFDF